MADKIDQFESVFRAAERPRFAYAPPLIERVLVVTDGGADDGRAFTEAIRTFVAPAGLDGAMFETLCRDDFDTIARMLELVEARQPDLIATYRNLHLKTQDLRHSLGAYLDTLTQATVMPVLVTPRPERDAFAAAMRPTDDVLVMTDHLAADVRTVNYGVRFAAKGGTVHLCHIEDDATFQRYMRAIERIPTIETDSARETIRRQLLKAPQEYIEACVESLRAGGQDVRINSVVRMGHCIDDYRELIKQHAGDLLVCNTNDDERLTMHPMAYALAIEVRDEVLLLL